MAGVAFAASRLRMLGVKAGSDKSNEAGRRRLRLHGCDCSMSKRAATKAEGWGGQRLWLWGGGRSASVPGLVGILTC